MRFLGRGPSRGRKDLDEVLGDDELAVVPDWNELRVMSHGVLETINGSDARQVEARLGVTLGEAWALLDRIGEVYDARRPQEQGEVGDRSGGRTWAVSGIRARHELRIVRRGPVRDGDGCGLTDGEVAFAATRDELLVC
ncbi:MAG: hypothetical protein LBJ08_07890 [Bifidobacteriaceae bacterium]|jgi:hypothetical protein|nr:hypothetical protein [Bifidobacteriaceae bacterium]